MPKYHRMLPHCRFQWNCSRSTLLWRLMYRPVASTCPTTAPLWVQATCHLDSLESIPFSMDDKSISIWTTRTRLNQLMYLRLIQCIKSVWFLQWTLQTSSAENNKWTSDSIRALYDLRCNFVNSPVCVDRLEHDTWYNLGQHLPTNCRTSTFVCISGIGIHQSIVSCPDMGWIHHFSFVPEYIRIN